MNQYNNLFCLVILESFQISCSANMWSYPITLGLDTNIPQNGLNIFPEILDFFPKDLKLFFTKYLIFSLNI